MRRGLHLAATLLTVFLTSKGPAQSAQVGEPLNRGVAPTLNAGRQALAAKQFAEAERCFRQALAADASNVNARMGLAEAELGMHRYEESELDYRKVVAAEPQMWVAHKNLVIIEAALSRWEEFDRARALLRAARERGADGISSRESDVIDGFTADGRRWIVREYFEPVGRAQARYNFESFEVTGRAAEYISLESEAAAARATQEQNQGIAVGDSLPPVPSDQRFALNWYTGKAHGVVKVYPSTPNASEPSYEQVRADVLHWLRRQRRKAPR